MQRYFLNECSHRIEVNNNSEIYYHLSKVLRAREGDVVEFCDLDGNCYQYEIDYISKEVICFMKLSEALDNLELPNKVVLAVSLLKNNNFELVLQKAVEIGVTDIIAFESERTIIKSSNFNAKKLDRFRKIILEASEQSKRNKIPKFHGIYSFSQLSEFECSNKFIAYESCNVGRDNFLINKLIELDNDVMVIVGPEGGFSKNEIDECGFEVVSLGKRILRAETAAIYAVSVIASIMESKGGIR
ncbi:MAG: RsmE family RNA methyltransferase [Bacilli bacterium]